MSLCSQFGFCPTNCNNLCQTRVVCVTGPTGPTGPTGCALFQSQCSLSGLQDQLVQGIIPLTGTTFGAPLVYNVGATGPAGFSYTVVADSPTGTVGSITRVGIKFNSIGTTSSVLGTAIATGVAKVEQLIPTDPEYLSGSDVTLMVVQEQADITVSGVSFDSFRCVPILPTTSTIVSM